jgi:hypothetical protein
MIRNDMDLVSGRSDASRANLIKPKTATEAEIMQQAMQSRVGERRDTHEDLLSDMGEAALEIALRDLTKAEVQQIAGEDAEWPENPETVETIFRQVSVKVRAGSSGKPNQQKEREQWGQLLPVIKETMQAVAELRAQGNYDMAEAACELLRETLRRFDEHLDLDAIIPPTEKDENGKPIAQQQAAMELVQCKQRCSNARRSSPRRSRRSRSSRRARPRRSRWRRRTSAIETRRPRTTPTSRSGRRCSTRRPRSSRPRSPRRCRRTAKDEEAQQKAVEAALSDERLGRC